MTLQWVTQWIALFPMVGAMVLVWFGTSYYWLRLCRIPGVVALAASPAVTTVLIWALSLLWQKLGLFWSGARVLPLLALVGFSGVAVYFWQKYSGRLYIPWSDKYRSKFVPGILATSIACFIGWLLAALTMILAAPPINPVQQWDPTFHMNGVWSITQHGVAAPGEGLSHNYGGAETRAYPIAWHAFTSLFATGPTTVLTSNASSLALMALWVIAMAAFVRYIYPTRLTSLAAPIIAGVLASMPADALTAYQQTPNAMSVAVLPGIAALAVLSGRQVAALLEGRGSLWRDFIPTVALTLVALYGGIQAHPVVAFNLLILLVPAAVAGSVALVVWALRQRKYAVVATVVGASLAAVAMLVFVMLTPQVTSMRNYNRGGIGVSIALSQVFIPTPPFPRSLGVPLTAGLLTVMAAVGAAWIVRAKHSGQSWVRWVGAVRPVAWPIVSWVLFLVLVFFAYGPNWPIRKWIVGPWFSDGRRIMEPMGVPLTMLAAVGFEWAALSISRYWNQSRERRVDAEPSKNSLPSRSVQGIAAAALGSILLIGTVGGGLDGRVPGAQTVMDPHRLGRSGMATEGVLEMMRSLPGLLPEGSIVLGDPQAGAMYSQMIGQRVAFFPQLGYLNQDRESQAILTRSFNQISVNPDVCRVIKEQGITHYYQYPDGYYYSTLRSSRAPGLYDVDTSKGFELVAQGDEARLYKITACN